ncbi:hypothetical protein CSB45_05660 [candidate division KSB3 bacterium]|uniref:Uncharacterized protein n=1 Tax=candidate division KSB3 bacterium TaxID=2044937 RepID=A0A2G6E7H6_9BACT|nr:MAG: hypothetical protein CSB45_05660 [candidate division KSB3 bacterium]PIE30141.1 MAG: hypothetical protein CSA57_04370 [candidate division KSB3 bacterium]
MTAADVIRAEFTRLLICLQLAQQGRFAGEVIYKISLESCCQVNSTRDAIFLLKALLRVLADVHGSHGHAASKIGAMR